MLEVQSLTSASPPRRDRTTVAYACRVVEDGRDDIWFDCRVATLELVCRRLATGGDSR